MQIKSSSPILQATIQQASSAVKESIDSIPGLTDEQKRQVADAVDKTDIPTPAAEVPNTFVYWLAVGAVALVASVIVLGGLYLAASGKETPNFLQTALATAIGALAGMVVPTPKSGL
jgi:uncharacterized membrane protein YbhN (UPF0104 family)